MRTDKLKLIGSRILVLVALVALSNNIKAVDLPSNLETYLETATVTEFGVPSGTEQQVTDFANFLQANWSDVLADIENVAPDIRRQHVVAAMGEFLPGADYVSFMSGLIDKYEANKIEKAVIIDAMSPGGKKYGFFAYNYQHSSVIALCQRVQTLFPNETELQSLIADTLSGNQGKQIGAALFMENRPTPEILPSS